MKTLTKSGNGYAEESVSGLNAVMNVVKTPVKPLLGEALSTQEAIVSNVFYFLVGAVIGGTVGYKYVKKAQSAYNALRNNPTSTLAKGSASDYGIEDEDEEEDIA